MTVVAGGTCKKGLGDTLKQDLFKSIILTVLNPEFECKGSCQTLDAMTKKDGSLLSLVDRNALNFELVTGRTEIKAGEATNQRTFGLYFEGISEANKITIGFENEQATGTPSLNKPTNNETLANFWNFYTALRLKLYIGGKATILAKRNLATDRTGLLRV